MIKRDTYSQKDYDMKKPFDISEQDKIKILNLHLVERYNFGSRMTEQLTPKGIKNENPKQVINTSEYNGKMTIITYNSDGSYSSNVPLIGNTKSLKGTWKYIPQPGTGGKILYSSGGVVDGFIQEIGRDLVMTDDLRNLLNQNPSEYQKLPVMTKLLNLVNSSYSSDTTRLSVNNQPNRLGCPTGCVKDPSIRV